MHVDTLKNEDYENTGKLNFGYAVRKKYGRMILISASFGPASSHLPQVSTKLRWFWRQCDFGLNHYCFMIPLSLHMKAYRLYTIPLIPLKYLLIGHCSRFRESIIALHCNVQKWSQLNTDINLLIHYTKFSSPNNMCHYVTSQLKQYMLIVKTSPCLLREGKR